MTQHLVSRPGYGTAPIATAQLPGGGPSGRGRSLSEDIPGTQTFVKPLDDNGTSQNAPEQSLYRTDGPRDVGKRQDGDDSIDHSQATPGVFGLGERDPNDFSKTKYPYRDGKPNSKNASFEFVAQLYILERKAAIALSYEEGMAIRVAATAEQMIAGLNPKFVERAGDIGVTLQRADIPNLRWVFSIKGATGKHYAVRVKALRPKGNVTRFAKMDLEVACSCPAWQWQGPEYHAKGQKYQLGKPVGTASTPDIRDPDRHNKVCKHVAAVLATTRDWVVPVRKR